VSSVVGYPRARSERKETRKTSALAKKSTTMCACSHVMTQLKSENVNININKNLILVKSKQNKNSV